MHLPGALLDLLDSGQKDAFDATMAKAQDGASPAVARTMAFRAKPYGQADPFGLFAEVRTYPPRPAAHASPYAKPAVARRRRQGRSAAATAIRAVASSRMSALVPKFSRA